MTSPGRYAEAVRLEDKDLLSDRNLGLDKDWREQLREKYGDLPSDNDDRDESGPEDESDA